uniref:Uncharacterized protein n=1 Tax=Globodera rostochiensis TaxID=31243 RepID=A0A914H6J5_GLORO
MYRLTIFIFFFFHQPTDVAEFFDDGERNFFADGPIAATNKLPPKAALVRKLDEAKKGFSDAAKMADQLQNMLMATNPLSGGIHSKSGRPNHLRSDSENPFIDYWAADWKKCLCSGASETIQIGIKSSYSLGLSTIHHMCNQLTDKAPLTKDECRTFNTQVFTSTMNITAELTSRDVLCELVVGQCDQPSVPMKKDRPFSCTFCMTLHRKAHIMTENFSKLLTSFSLMCTRITNEPDEKKYCDEYVKTMAKHFSDILTDHFADARADYHCHKMFKCTGK